MSGIIEFLKECMDLNPETDHKHIKTEQIIVTQPKKVIWYMGNSKFN